MSSFIDLKFPVFDIKLLAKKIVGKKHVLAVTLTDIDGSSLFDEGALTIIDFPHQKIHEGDHYYLSGYDTFDAAGDVDIQLTTPDTNKFLHMTFLIEATGETVFTIYEDADIAADGTPVTAYNNDRNSANTSGLQLLQSDGTVNSAGSAIYHQSFGITNTPSKSEGGETERENEIVLKRNTTYRFFIESNSADNIISWVAEWYESEV